MTVSFPAKAFGLCLLQERGRAIVFRLGRFTNVRAPGLYRIIAPIERRVVLDMRTETVDLELQETIAKDSVTIHADAVLWYRVSNLADAIIQVADFDPAVYQPAVTALRNAIGQHQLDEVLK